MLRLIALVPALAGCDLVFQVDRVDEGPKQRPAVVAGTGKVAACAQCSNLELPVTVTSGRATSLLLVSIAVSTSGTSPGSSSVTYAGQPLTFLQRRAVTEGSEHPLLEQWLLVDPTPGDFAIDVTLNASANELLVGAVEIEGARAKVPVRTMAALASGAAGGVSITQTIESSDFDLVVDAVCVGDRVDVPGPDQRQLYVLNATHGTTCGNLGASQRDGAAPTVQLQWEVNGGNGSDFWVHLAHSIAP